MKKYHYSILGGTFDRFHAGHQRLIDTACEQSDQVAIGITTEKFYQNKTLAHIIENYSTRENALKNYLKEKGYQDKVTLIQLQDIYGSSLKQKNIDAIFITNDTKLNAEKLNQERQKIGFPPMQIVPVPFATSSDNQIITAERIRKGEINRQGNLYMDVFTHKDQLTLPENLREQLRQPIGTIITQKEDLKKLLNPNDLIITVGDIVSLFAREADIIPALSIIDFKTRRESLEKKAIQTILKYEKGMYSNPPGTIQTPVVQILKEKLDTYLTQQKPQILAIDGEEDLLTLPAILIAPLETIIIYGIFEKGAVIVKVTEERKAKTKNLLCKFL